MDTILEKFRFKNRYEFRYRTSKEDELQKKNYYLFSTVK